MEVVKKHLLYAGVDMPTTAEELIIEIYGLKNVIKQAEELITRYEQAKIIADVLKREVAVSEENIKRKTE